MKRKGGKKGEMERVRGREGGGAKEEGREGKKRRGGGGGDNPQTLETTLLTSVPPYWTADWSV